MGAGASASVTESAPYWAHVVICGDYAVLGAMALGTKAIEKSVPLADRGDKKLAFIVDTGRPDIWYERYHPSYGILTAELRQEVDLWIIVMPGTDSAANCLGSSFSVSMQLPLWICSGAEDGQMIRFVHRDYYFANPLGEVDVPAYISAKDDVIFPASRRMSMIDWFTNWYDTVWANYRAGIYFGVNFGCEENEFKEGIDTCKQLLKEGPGADVEFTPITGEPDLAVRKGAHARLGVGSKLAAELGVEEFDAAKKYDLKTMANAITDLYVFIDLASYSKDIAKALDKLWESFSEGALTGKVDCTAVIIAKNIDSFACKDFAWQLHNIQEGCTWQYCIFATHDDVDKVKSVFFSSSSPPPSGRILGMAMVPFPSMRFCTLLGKDCKTCGQEVPDKALLFPSLKCGYDAPTLPNEKLGFRQMQFRHGSEDPIGFQVIPGESKATVIQPGPILIRIFKKAVEEDSLAEEVECSVNDIISEHQQWARDEAGDDENCSDDM
eukprot:TRINITY_DN39283_c0_g1_i1.p1 TRINITY_DN39283_c0_g1~~TRINITY_DN39283_c0_g1_i1.p1  ORF type:complete len:496 (-),score=57.10 TRINITY_DN39283_c0_g1_i1:44-1531(-)